MICVTTGVDVASTVTPSAELASAVLAARDVSVVSVAFRVAAEGVAMVAVIFTLADSTRSTMSAALTPSRLAASRSLNATSSKDATSPATVYETVTATMATAPGTAGGGAGDGDGGEGGGA